MNIYIIRGITAFIIAFGIASCDQNYLLGDCSPYSKPKPGVTCN